MLLKDINRDNNQTYQSETLRQLLCYKIFDVILYIINKPYMKYNKINKNPNYDGQNPIK